MKWLIVGLGNPGAEYARTRHNIGFLWLDFVSQQSKVSFQPVKNGAMAQYTWKGRQVLLLKPDTYMNLSGKAVSYHLQKEKISLLNLIVATDDIALPFGKLRLKGKGSSGGHNGLKNISELLQTDAYPRLRMGVGNSFPKGKQIDYVLGEFSSGESAQLPILFEWSTEALHIALQQNLEVAMTWLNGKQLPE
jgi:PTH1 family peptidyl-tRNA hydrolase